MAGEYQALIQTLKQTLKEKKITYRQLADSLKVSEQTLKRFFTQEDGSVGRIAEICDVIGVNFFRLAEFSNERREKQFKLDESQELFFAENPWVYGYFNLLLRGRTPGEIATQFGLSPARIHALHRDLEAQALIERMEGERIRVLVNGAHNWIEGGPLALTLGPKFVVAFVEHCLKSQAAQHLEDKPFITSSLKQVSPETAKSFVDEMQDLLKNFRRRAEIDQTLLPYERLVSFQWVVAMTTLISPFEQHLLDFARDETR